MRSAWSYDKGDLRVMGPCILSPNIYRTAMHGSFLKGHGPYSPHISLPG